MAAKAGDQVRQKRRSVVEAERSLAREPLQPDERRAVQRVAGGGGHAGHGGLEFLRKPGRVELAQEELRQVLGIVGMSVSPAGHAQPVEGVDAGQTVAQRLKNPGDRAFASRQVAHALEVNGAQAPWSKRSFRPVAATSCT